MIIIFFLLNLETTSSIISELVNPTMGFPVVGE